MSYSVPRIALTSGEPAGIGPDLCIQISQHDQDCELVVIADPELIMQRAKQLKLKIALNLFDPSKPSQLSQAGSMTILSTATKNQVFCGQLDAANSAYVIKTIKIAIQGCVKGLFMAMVTAPVHKEIINDAGIYFSGHTEFIADITGGYPVMMLATSGLRVALVTTHIALSKVSQSITRERLISVIHTLNTDLQERFLLAKPRILVCGLNPHAGEGGYLGREEIEIIKPVLADLCSQGIDLQGPLSADTLFIPQYLKSADVVLAMYHDQGLPVLKHSSFGKAVNITLGLPIIRTSVDHGSAIDLAGTMLANTESLQYAIKTALQLKK